MTGAPTVTVAFDDGTGTYPFSVTSKFRLTDGWSISSYGRTDEFNQASPAQITLTLDNADGAWSAGGFGLVPFGMGDFGSGANAIYPGQGLRVSATFGATTRNRFTGVVTSLDLSWPTGDDGWSVLTINAVDPLAGASRKILRSMLEQEILADAPTAYYTLGEAEGSTAAGDTSGHQAVPLAISGTGTAPTFGTGTGPVDSLSCIQFTGGQYLSGNSRTGFLGTGAWTVECWFASTTPAAGHAFLMLGNSGGKTQTFVSLLSTGNLRAFLFPLTLTSAARFDDGLTHHVVFSFDGATTATLKVDDVMVATSASFAPFDSPVTALYLGGGVPAPGLLLTVSPYAGTLAHAALYDGAVLSSARATVHDQIGDAVAETTAARLTRLASYGGLTASTLSGSGQTVGAQETSGANLFDAMQTVAAAEGGVLYCNGDGTVVLQGRGYRALRTTADLTLTSADVNPDVVQTWDTQQLINQVTVTGASGATQLVVSGKGDYPTTLDVPVDDASALGQAQWLVSKHTTTGKRIRTMTLSLLTDPNAAEAMLNLEVGKRLKVTNMPLQTFDGTTLDLSVEGWTETLTATSWDLTLNLLPWALFTALIIDDPVYGAIDSYPVMN